LTAPLATNTTHTIDAVLKWLAERRRVPLQDA
jgi:hypothetical protein